MINGILTFFLRFGDGRHAVAETPDTAARLIARGYTRIDRATFMECWRAEDLARAIRLFGPVLVNPYETEN